MSNSSITARQLQAVLFATEHDNNPATLRRFSYAGGDSSYSFGLLQFDVRKRSDAQQFLSDNGFTRADVEDLTHLGGLTQAQLSGLDAKLRAIPEAKLNEFTYGRLQENIVRVDLLIEGLKTSNPAAATAISRSKELQLALADYDNQFGIEGIGTHSRPNTMLAFLEGQPVRRNGEALQLADRLDRRDIQNYIDGTGYAQAHPRSVASREERLVGALSKLGVLDQGVFLAADQPLPVLLRFGASGREVAELQERLAELGYTDAKGHPVAADGQFGPVTQAAVEAFQHDRGLIVDGKVGALTRGALDAALVEGQVAAAVPHPRGREANPAGSGVAQVSMFTDAGHPQRALYEKLQSLFPDGTSEARLCQAVAACRTVGIGQPQQLASVIATDDIVYFGSHEPGGATGQMDISRPAPAVGQSLWEVQHFDLQQTRTSNPTQEQPSAVLDGQ